jgi:energy-converting hydrogenase Eha subunit F
VKGETLTYNLPKNPSVTPNASIPLALQARGGVDISGCNSQKNNLPKFDKKMEGAG